MLFDKKIFLNKNGSFSLSGLFTKDGHYHFLPSQYVIKNPTIIFPPRLNLTKFPDSPLTFILIPNENVLRKLERRGVNDKANRNLNYADNGGEEDEGANTKTV